MNTPNWKAFNILSLCRHRDHYVQMIKVCGTPLAAREYQLVLDAVNAEIESRMSKLRGTPNGP